MQSINSSHISSPAVRLRIVYFVTSLESGGTERQLMLLLKNLPSDQYEKHLVCLSGYGTLEAEARLHCHAMYDLKYPRVRIKGKLQWRRLPHLLTPVPKLAWLLRRIRPHVLHTLIPVCNVMGALAAKLSGTRGLVASRLSLGNYRDKNRLFARLEDFTDSAFCVIHCKSQGIARDVIVREPVAPERVHIVYNGLEVTQYQSGPVARSEARQRLGLSPTAAIIGVVANLWEYKGHIDLIKAMPEVIETQPDAICLFIGRDDGMRTQIQNLAQELGIAHRIILAGERNDVPGLLPGMDVLVSASHEEGFSNVILEAMASRLPVVATDIGGNPEQVIHEVTGLLVPVQSPLDMAMALKRILSDKSLRASMGDSGRRRVISHFSSEAMAEGMRAIYATAASPSPSHLGD